MNESVDPYYQQQKSSSAAGSVDFSNVQIVQGE